MVRVRTKICGITRRQDAINAVNEGVDAIGLVFYQPSPRSVDIEAANKICDSLSPFITVVGLFVNSNIEYVKDVCQKVPLTLLQFHGDETEEFCDSFSLPYIKAIRVKDSHDVESALNDYKSASGILVDAYVEGVPGGTGKSFDWALLPKETSKPLILAGGLTPNNVHNAILEVQPYAVDVSGGVELTKGIKDNEKITRFINEVSRASEYKYN